MDYYCFSLRGLRLLAWERVVIPSGLCLWTKLDGSQLNRRSALKELGRGRWEAIVGLLLSFFYSHFTHPVNCICIEVHWLRLNSGGDRQESQV